MSIKNILICTSQVPLSYGGTEILVQCLRQALLKRGFQVDVVSIPFRHYPNREILKGHLVWRLLDLTESDGQKVDMIIATKFPSYLAQHPNKVTWLVHQFRQAYDLVGTEFSPFTNSEEDSALLRVLHRLDTIALKESKRLFAISGNVAKRLARYNGLHATTLYPPPQHEGLYRNDGYGDYILAVSRLNRWKRLDLLVQAMALTKQPARCLIVGEGPEEEQLKRLIQEYKLGDRVELLGFVDDQRLLQLYANCFAFFFAPYDEDYGLVTLEAFKSQKPVITAEDSGGVLEFVEDGLNGYVASTGTPTEFADYIDRLYADRRLCQKLGQAGYERVRDITWDRTVDQLLGLQ
ncbi:MAG: glycosyltransferase family 4 protein [Anaerolineae bacterium]